MQLKEQHQLLLADHLAEEEQRVALVAVQRVGARVGVASTAR